MKYHIADYFVEMQIFPTVELSASAEKFSDLKFPTTRFVLQQKSNIKLATFALE